MATEEAMFGCILAESLPPAIRARLNHPGGDGWNAFQVYAAGASGPRAMVNMGWVGIGGRGQRAWGMGIVDKHPIPRQNVSSD